MSETAHGYVEILYPGMEFIRDAVRIQFDAIPDLHAVLAYPWGEPEEGDELPPPIRPPRGFPADAGLLVLSETTLYVCKEKDPTNLREITRRETKGLRRFKTKTGRTLYFDPDVKCPTWLTREEVALAAERYTEHCGHESPDLEAVEAMMRQYERPKLPGGHPKTRLVVWFT